MRRLACCVFVVIVALNGCDDGGTGTAAEGAPDSARVRDARPAHDVGADAGFDPDATRQDDASPEAGASLDATADPDATRELDIAFAPDAAPGDAAPDGQRDAAPDAAPDAAACPPPPDFDYACDLADPSTCPAGLCLFGLCLGPVVDADRWAGCGDGACDPCEDADTCPADCAAAPVLRGVKRYDAPNTLTIVVGGFNVVGADEFAAQTFGALSSAGIGELARPYAPEIPDGRDDPDAPNQMVGVRYYGDQPADWLSPEQVATIRALDWRTPDALRRYALIVAYFIRARLASTGADYVNLACHSMGCHVIRYLVEHDLEELASDQKIVRWTTVAGVVAGARLARLFDNPQIREIAEGLQLNTSDFVHMNPDYVRDHSARWDHRLHVAGNPLFAGILIHHQVATDPRVSQTANLVRLLDLNNPQDLPNDGIMYSDDEYFEDQPEALRIVSTEGHAIPPTRSYQHFDHELIKESAGTGIIAAAALFHRRKVFVSVRVDRLVSDLEQDQPFDFQNEGQPPAELVVESTVRYDPYLLDRFGESSIVHQQRIEDRSPEVRVVAEGEGDPAPIPVFSGPVFDDMDAITVDIDVLEVDDYNRFGVHESLFDREDRVIQYVGELPLEDAEIPLVNANFEGAILVRMETMY